MTAIGKPARVLGALALGLSAAAAYGAPASAAPVSCGDVITVDTVLTQDLTCGPGDALVIGANGITLDLGGHTITGPGAYGAGAGAGVRAAQRTGAEKLHECPDSEDCQEQRRRIGQPAVDQHDWHRNLAPLSVLMDWCCQQRRLVKR